jgi:hypothetical protein
VVAEGRDNAIYHTACNNSKDETLPKDRGASAKPIATYVATASQSRRFGIRSQHSGKQERDRPDYSNYHLAHVNVPTVQRPCDEISANKKQVHPPSMVSVLAERALAMFTLPLQRTKLRAAVFFTTCSAGSLTDPDFCLIFAPLKATMNQKSSLPQSAKSVSEVLTPDTEIE